MSRLLITILSLCLVLKVHAQVSYGENATDVARNKHWTDSTAKWRVDHRIICLREFSYKPDTITHKGYMDYELKYDQRGNMAESSRLNKKGKLLGKASWTWDDQNRYIGYKSLKRNGKLRSMASFGYNASGDLVDEKYYYKKPGYVSFHNIKTYNDQHNIVGIQYLSKNDKKKGWRVVYSYYPDGSKKQTIMYDRKGKIKHTWNYDCNAIGKMDIKKLKDTSKLCIRYELDKDGKQVKIKEEFVKSGIVVRIISKYDSHENLLEELRYDKKGKLVYHTVSSYGSNNKLTEYKEFKSGSDKIRSRRVYYYRSDGTVAEMMDYKRNDKLKEIVKYEYVKG